jgi:hypothetical protein
VPEKFLTDDQVYQIATKALTTNTPSKNKSIFGAVFTITAFVLFIKFLYSSGKLLPPEPFVISLLGVNFLWNLLMFFYWKPVSDGEYCSLSEEKLQFRSYESETWAMLWNGGVQALLSVIMWGWAMLTLNLDFNLGWINVLLTVLYWIFWPILIWQRRLILRIGIDPALNFGWVIPLGGILVALLWGLGIFLIVPQSLNPLSFDFKSLIPYLIGAALFTVNYLALGEAIRTFYVSFIHFNVIRSRK